MKRLFTLLFLFISVSSFALDPNHFTITRVTAPYFIVDGNAPSTITAAYVGFEIKNNNNSGVTYSGLKFTITSITSSVVGQNYSVQSPADGINIIGTLAPGESKLAYFYVKYPASTTPIGTFNVSLSDNTPTAKTTSFNIRNRSSISANAGGAATQSFTVQDVPGGIVTDDVTYTVGNVQNNDEADFQVAVSSQFDPSKIILLSTRVTASTVPGITVGSTDSLYYITGNGSNGASVTIRWTFKIAATNFTTYILPCAGATSGNTNYKYTLNSSLGSGSPVTVGSPAAALTITKTSDLSIYPYGATAQFTVKICNPSVYNVTIDKITDELPAGFTYVGLTGGSGVTAANSTSLPTTGATGTITYQGGVTSGGNTSYYIPASGCISLIYTATAPSSQALNLKTNAKYYVGTNVIDSAQNTVSVSSVLASNWLNYGAKLNSGNQATISWKVQEANIAGYEIEKNTSIGNNYIAITNIASKGDGINAYSFTETQKATTSSLYRIKQVSRDGQVKYSPVISLANQQAALMTVFPNPVKNTVNISLNYLGAKISLSDYSGKLLQQFTNTEKRFSVSMEKYSKGMYILKIDDQPVQKIIKQ